MKIKSFLKLLNKKIKKYDRAATNPFDSFPITITLVWIDEENAQDKEFRQADLN